MPSGDVVIGLPETVGLGVTVPLVALCRTQFQSLRLKVIEAPSGFLREWLLSGRPDLSAPFGDSEDASLVKRPLLDERLVLVTSTDGKCVPRSLTLTEVAHWPLVLPGTGARATPDHRRRFDRSGSSSTWWPRSTRCPA